MYFSKMTRLHVKVILITFNSPEVASFNKCVVSGWSIHFFFLSSIVEHSLLLSTKSCSLNSHYKSCGTACPASCQYPFSSRTCTLSCVETCQCHLGFILDGNTCVPLSLCVCTHNSYSYHSNHTFRSNGECSKMCVCDPQMHHTHTICIVVAQMNIAVLEIGSEAVRCTQCGHACTWLIRSKPFDHRHYNFQGSSHYL